MSESDATEIATEGDPGADTDEIDAAETKPNEEAFEAEWLEDCYRREVKVMALDVPERETILAAHDSRRRSGAALASACASIGAIRPRSRCRR